ncbi:MAG: hypothetical protein ACI4OR_00405 [Alphaproteobacteria bacterium]
MIEKTPTMNLDRKQTILSYLGISETEWDKVCARNSELATLKPEMLIRHFTENAQGLGFDHKTWVKICQKTPQLYEMNLATLKKHIAENAQVMGISEDKWIKICSSEPGLFTYHRQTLEKNLHLNAAALGISKDRWCEVCAKRGALLTYKPETLVKKVDKFLEYVYSPSDFLKSQTKPSETMHQTLKNFEGVSLERDKVIEAFLRHPNNFLSTPEKLAYSFAYIKTMTKAFGLNENPYRILPYIDLSVESNLKMRYFYACLHHHKKQEVSLVKLVKEKKNDIRKTLLTAVQSKEVSFETADEIIAAYPCPFLKRLKENETHH